MESGELSIYWFQNYLANGKQFVSINNIDSNIGNINCGVSMDLSRALCCS